MRSRGDAHAKIKRLDDLEISPREQISYALHLIDEERSAEVVQAALDVLAGSPPVAARPSLLKRYEHCEADGARRDAGGYIRSAILRTLRPLVTADDIPLLERATSTYEF